MLQELSHVVQYDAIGSPEKAWMFAALSTVEPPILELATARILEGDKPWSKERILWSWIARATARSNFPLASAAPTGSMARSARTT